MCELRNVNSACYDNPCAHSGSCVHEGSLSEYKCQCLAGYTGNGVSDGSLVSSECPKEHSIHYDYYI